MYFDSFNEKTRDILNKDKDKYIILSWIIFNTNYQEEGYNGLKNRECYFSCRVIESLFDITRKKTLKIMKELEEEGFIKWTYKSKSKKEKSIIYLYESSKKTAPVEAPVNAPVGEPVKSLDNTGIEGDCKPVNAPVNAPVVAPLSINISRNKSNYYNTIFEFWVAKGIKKHRSLNNDIKKAIDKALKEYTVEEIKQAIDNYSTMYHDKEYTWCSYQWGLDQLLVKTDKDRMRQLPMFLNDGSKWTSYLSFKNKDNIIPLNNKKDNKTGSTRAEKIKHEAWGGN